MPDTVRGRIRWAPGIVLAAGCLLMGAGSTQHRVPPAAPLTSIPTDFAGYTGRNEVVPEDQRQVAGMSDYVMRIFSRDSTDVFSVYVGYYDYQVQGKTIHSPKNCLPGAGWETMQESTAPVTVAGRTYPVKRYLLANGAARAMVYYWYQGRGRIEANEYKVKWDLLRDAALHGRTEEALVRVVVPVAIPADATPASEAAVLADADRIAVTAAERMIPAVDRVMPRAAGA
jgi:EpsI family protein